MKIFQFLDLNLNHISEFDIIVVVVVVAVLCFSLGAVRQFVEHFKKTFNIVRFSLLIDILLAQPDRAKLAGIPSVSLISVYVCVCLTN